MRPAIEGGFDAPAIDESGYPCVGASMRPAIEGGFDEFTKRKPGDPYWLQ